MSLCVHVGWGGKSVPCVHLHRPPRAHHEGPNTGNELGLVLSAELSLGTQTIKLCYSIFMQYLLPTLSLLENQTYRQGGIQGTQSRKSTASESEGLDSGSDPATLPSV